MDLNTDMFAVL